ncbi:MAG TPA: hypothetical protein VFA62_05390 [Acidimicrobiia bacterium]|nr:hypothetical protein [Acidimicrobiia bacterium]
MTTEYRDYQWTDGEALTSSDLTNAQRYLYEQQWDALYTLSITPGDGNRTRALLALSALDVAPYTTLGDFPNTSRVLHHREGIIALRVWDREEDHSDDGSPAMETIIPVVLATDQCSVTIPAAHPTLDRLDAVYLSFRRDNGPTEQRDFEDAMTRAKSTLMVSPYRRSRCFATVVSGTPGAVTPGDIPNGPNSVVPPGEEVNPLNRYDALWCVVYSHAGSTGVNQTDVYDYRWPARARIVDTVGLAAGRQTFIPGTTKTSGGSTYVVGQSIFKGSGDPSGWFELSLPMDPFQRLTGLGIVASGITSLALYRTKIGFPELIPANLLYDFTGKPGGPPWDVTWQYRALSWSWPIWGNGLGSPILYQDDSFPNPDLRKPVLYGTANTGIESWLQFIRLKVAG